MGDFDAERRVWTADDFESMSWHDCTVHAFAAQPESFGFALDIDYIVEWLCSPDGRGATFKVAPCTLVLDNVSDVRVDLDMGNTLSIQIDSLTRSEPRALASGQTEWLWSFKCQSVGAISLRATGLRQYARRRPIMCAEQFLDSTARGGISFAQGLCEP